MDVRVKLFWGMTVLFLTVVTLGILVYVGSTSGPLDTNENAPLFEPIPVNPSSSPERNNNTDTAGPEPEEPEIIATVTLEDNRPLSKKTEIGDTESTEASYTVRMAVSWSEQLHPLWYPTGAHLSPMVAWSHRLDDVVFATNKTATDGMEQMAETGATQILEQEIQAFIADGYIASYETGQRIDAPGENSVRLTLSRNAPRVSVVSMIAPSPDWFISAHNVTLFENGRWTERKTVDAVLYDAGTDSGITFTARNNDTNPPEPITRLLPDSTIPITVPIAVFEFIRTE